MMLQKKTVDELCELFKNEANQIKEKNFKAINTIIGIVIKDIKVDTTIILDILSTISFGEYIEAIKYVKIALGIED